MYSLWLKPSIESFRRYQSIISSLSDIHQTPKFEPHITLNSEIDELSDENFYQLSVLAALTKVFDVKSTALSIQNNYYQSLYAVIQSNPPLKALRAEFENLFPNKTDSFQPHLSLIYSNLPKVKKLKIIQNQRKSYPKLIGLEGIQVMKTVGKPENWEIVEYFPFYD